MSEKNKVEAVLFASGRSMDIETIAQITLLDIKKVQSALLELKKDYESKDTALFIWSEATRWKINVKEEYTELVRSITAETEMQGPVMATLALIAHRSPVLQSEIIKARGEGAYAHIAELVEKEFITKEKYQRSFKLKLADKFFNYFDVEGQDLRDAFKDIKPNVKPKKLGKLEIVQAETDEEADLDRRRRETQIQIYDIKQQREGDKEFLEGFDSRLEDVKKNVSVAEEDIVHKKQDVQKEQDMQDEQDYQNHHGVEEKEAAQQEDDPQDLDDPRKLAQKISEDVDELTKDQESSKHSSSRND